MIVPDVNLLLYAHDDAMPEHERAKRWWEGVVNGEQTIGMPWAVLMGFVRIVTHPSVLSTPLPPAEALSYLRAWLDLPGVRLLDPGPRHLQILEELFRAVQVAGSLTTDAHLAALAIEHQAELHSNDADFARFPGLRWHNPLA